jgi:hypothetical protein
MGSVLPECWRVNSRQQRHKVRLRGLGPPLRDRGRESAKADSVLALREFTRQRSVSGFRFLQSSPPQWRAFRNSRGTTPRPGPPCREHMSAANRPRLQRRHAYLIVPPPTGCSASWPGRSARRSVPHHAPRRHPRHAEVWIGGAVIEGRRRAPVAAAPAALHLYVDDSDACTLAPCSGRTSLYEPMTSVRRPRRRVRDRRTQWSSPRARLPVRRFPPWLCVSPVVKLHQVSPGHRSRITPPARLAAARAAPAAWDAQGGRHTPSMTTAWATSIPPCAR